MRNGEGGEKRRATVRETAARFFPRYKLKAQGKLRTYRQNVLEREWVRDLTRGEPSKEGRIRGVSSLPQ